MSDNNIKELGQILVANPNKYKKRIGFIFNYTENNDITTVIFMFVSRNPVNRLKLIKLKEVYVCCPTFLQYLLNAKTKKKKKKEITKVTISRTSTLKQYCPYLDPGLRFDQPCHSLRRFHRLFCCSSSSTLVQK